VAHPLSAIAGSFAPHPAWLAVAVLVDLAAGDPVYRWHPVRLIGTALSWIEARLRDAGLDGYGGGILLFIALAGLTHAALAGLLAGAVAVGPWMVAVVHLAVLYSLLALGDLLHHVWRIESALGAGDLARARAGVRQLVGRDTDRLDAGGCRRAAVESLSENLTDGFVSPVFWYAIAGLPGLVLFKVVSTMDSMVGYKTPRYLRFGWCGARLDDVMNYLPARLT
jgi:adenosylcobinamide-phosphate synthase